VVNVTTGKIVGAEALMRWQRGDKLVSPADFIPLAEDTGLIIPMGEWALHEACRKVRSWLDADFGSPYVSVNISGSHFKHRELLPTVERALLGTRTPPGLLQLEITETVAMHGVEATQRTLARAREMGVRVAIDDFGTGYSSLAYLKRLPIDTLKIDRSFVNDIARDADDEAIVSAIIGLARSLGLSIVAEGVENDNQVGFLSMFGATLMQGYLFARPVPEDEFVRLMEANVASLGNPAWKCPERSRVMHLFDGGRRRSAPPVEAALGLSKGAGPL
jgi:EAL domain-containing protein (putative c-di-GMP-specific phosphodiesterase class I)